ncbi:hypothetical protein EBR57_07565 [bacterium]|nr:hypothetical protein [bacterium]
MTEFGPLPLHVKTPEKWAVTALSHPLALLNDHFHLEKKAATNALDMMSRWQGEIVPIKWFNVMSAIAKDETDHMKLIAKIIAKRNGTCTKVHSNGYASALRHLVRKGTASVELMDRLLISALIELRSCERFHLLATTTTDPELQKLYTGLWGSEKGHYLQFIESAAWVMPPKLVQERWEIMLNLETQVIQSQPPGPRIHSWI